MAAFLQVWPAYGRRYPSAELMVQAFRDGQDFSASPQGGPYLSVRDLQGEELKDFDGVIFSQNGPGLVIRRAITFKVLQGRLNGTP